MIRKFSLGKGVKLIGEGFDNSIGPHIIALNKPSGILSHPNENDRDFSNCLIVGKYDHRKQCYIVSKDSNENESASGSNENIYLLNRLDSATSGVIIMTRDERVARVVKRLFAEREVTKTYIAVTFGNYQGPNKHVMWRDDIRVTNVKNQLRVSSDSSVAKKTACTIVSPIKRLGPQPTSFRQPLSFLRLNPQTGYTHQLRYACAKNRLPIVGDKIYGDFDSNKDFFGENKDIPKRLYLHSLCIEFCYDINGDTFKFKATAYPLASRLWSLIDSSSV